MNLYSDVEFGSHTGKWPFQKKQKKKSFLLLEVKINLLMKSAIIVKVWLMSYYNKYVFLNKSLK